MVKIGVESTVEKVKVMCSSLINRKSGKSKYDVMRLNSDHLVVH